MRRAAGVVCAALGLALLGAVVALALVAVHERWLLLSLGVAAVVAAFVALPRRWWARLPYAAGVTVVVALTAVPRGEGDYLIGADPQGYVVLGLTLVVVLVAPLSSMRPRPLDAAEPSESTVL